MTTWVPAVLAILLSASMINLVRDAVKAIIARRKRTQPEQVEKQRVHDAVAAADESIIVVAKARDELAEDNQRLREQSTIDRQRYERDRDDWRFEKAQMQAERREWEAERKAMVEEFSHMETRLRQALGELEGMKARYGISRKEGHNGLGK